MYGRVRLIFDDAKPALVIPAAALVLGTEGPRVVVVGAGDTVHFQKVTLGHDNGTTIEIVAGLKPGRHGRAESRRPRHRGLHGRADGGDKVRQATAVRFPFVMKNILRPSGFPLLALALLPFFLRLRAGPGGQKAGSHRARKNGRKGKGDAKAVVSETWWKDFGDAGLDAAVDKALARSPDLDAAAAQVRAARAAAGNPPIRFLAHFWSRTAAISAPGTPTASFPPRSPVTPPATTPPSARSPTRWTSGDASATPPTPPRRNTAPRTPRWSAPGNWWPARVVKLWFDLAQAKVDHGIVARELAARHAKPLRLMKARAATFAGMISAWTTWSAPRWTRPRAGWISMISNAGSPRFAMRWSPPSERRTCPIRRIGCRKRSPSRPSPCLRTCFATGRISPSRICAWTRRCRGRASPGPITIRMSRFRPSAGSPPSTPGISFRRAAGCGVSDRAFRCPFSPAAGMTPNWKLRARASTPRRRPTRPLPS